MAIFNMEDSTMEKKLQRIPHEGAVAGVCAGLGAYFGIDKTWVRVAFIFSVFFAGYAGIGLFGPVVYVILWIVLPVKSFTLPQDPFDVDYRASGAEQPDGYNYSGPYSSDLGNSFDQPIPQKKSKDRYVAGVILLAIGLFFLFHQLNILYWRDFARFWPVLIILMGLASIFGAFEGKKRTEYHSFEKQGPYTDQAEQSTESEDNGDEQHSYTK